MTSSLDIEALRAAAEKATPGPWIASAQQTQCEYRWFVLHLDQQGQPFADICQASNSNKAANAAFIALANSAAVLALIAQRDALLEAAREFSREYDGFEDGDGNPCPTLAKTRAAITLATGGGE
ncbi:MAG: ead/Ea22-like family protein [Caulobacter sp.]|nr:ead/Ea22-like family protein [Caulobacter sp.]